MEKKFERGLITSWRADGWLVHKHTDLFNVGIPDLEVKKAGLVLKLELKWSENATFSTTCLRLRNGKTQGKGSITGPQANYLRVWDTDATPCGVLVGTPMGWVAVRGREASVLWTQPLGEVLRERLHGISRTPPVLLRPMVGLVLEALLGRDGLYRDLLQLRT